MPESRRFPWHIVVAAVVAAVVSVTVRALLSPLHLFPVVEWGVSILVALVVGLVAANLVLARARARR